MKSKKEYDLIVIGFGKAGKTLAGHVAGKGYKVALIEKDDNMYGGTCINVGCLPTKSLVHRAKIIESAWRLGISSEIGEDRRRFAEAVVEKDRMTSMLRGKNYDKLANMHNIDVVDGEGSFEDSHNVLVKYGDSREKLLGGKVIVINTGSESRTLDVPGFFGNPHVHDSRSILGINELPKHLGIIGAGYIGLEFAAYFRAFGSKVTVLQHGDSFLPREDKEDSEAVRAHLEKIGVKFIFNADASSLNEINGIKDGVNIKLSFNHTVDSVNMQKELDLSELLVAVGRKPTTKGLDVEKAGVELGKGGEISVNDGLRTAQKHIFAVGDVKGGPQFTFISLDDYRIVLPQVLTLLEGREPLAVDPEHNRRVRPVFPNTTFIDPPYSRIGMSEYEARAEYDNVKVKKMPAAAVPKAQVVEETEGFLKVIIDQDTDLILGASLFCHESHEMINLFNLAINEKINATQLGNLIYNHPVMSESLNELMV